MKSIIAVSITVLVLGINYLANEQQRWLKLYEQVSIGCINPDNKAASVIIVLDHNQSWSCTPLVNYPKIRRGK